jgi:hypothetical protein
MLQAVAPMLQALALSLPLSATVLVPAALQPLAVALPASSLPLHPIPMPLQPLSPALEAPAVMPTMAVVTGMPSIRMSLGTLDGEGVERADLGGQRRRGEAQRGGEGERRVKTCHAFLPAAGPRGSKWSGSDSDGEDDDEAERALSRPDGLPYARKLSSARARLTCRRRLSAFSLICRTRSRVMPSRLPISSSVIGSGPSSPK